jgi:hypothetical protein
MSKHTISKSKTVLNKNFSNETEYCRIKDNKINKIMNKETVCTAVNRQRSSNVCYAQANVADNAA